MASQSNSITPAHQIRLATSEITPANRWDHLLARWAVNRNGHRVEPGLYALGAPDQGSPVFVTANYTLSFDALRSALDGRDAYMLVLDTHGINVWCAAGKGTFGTDELVNRIETTALGDVVDHRVLILPQLGAPGVAAHEVRRRSGFRVEYGPVRAADLPEYLRIGQATAEMRRVSFGLGDRVVLIPVELVHVLLPTAIAAAVLYFAGGWLAALAVVAAVLAGVVLFPILLPWLPTHDFTTKSVFVGELVGGFFALAMFLDNAGSPWWYRVGWALACLLAVPAITAFLALNFTGSTTFTSRTGVRREIFAYVPLMALAFGTALVLVVAMVVLDAIGAVA
jgi:hypothetical protein